MSYREIIDALPVMRMFPEEFKKLPDYSASMPTGTTPGKLWRRLDGSFDREFIAAGGQPRWIIGQYDPFCPDDAKTIKTFWYRPVIKLATCLPSAVTRPDMYARDCPRSFPCLREEIAMWVAERGFTIMQVTWNHVYFNSRNAAFEFRMRW
jgi:hypothetical protein